MKSKSKNSEKTNKILKTFNFLDYVGSGLAALGIIFLFFTRLNPAFVLNYMRSGFAEFLEPLLKILGSITPGYLTLKYLASFVSISSGAFASKATYELTLILFNVLFFLLYYWTANNIIKNKTKAIKIQLTLSILSVLFVLTWFFGAFNFFSLIQVIVGVTSLYFILKLK